MRIPFYKTYLAAAVSVAVGSFAMPAFADEAEQTEAKKRVALEEVVVTAQKREQDMQDTPISMAAFNAEAMERQSINDASDAAQYMPNVLVAESQGGSTGATAAIRGSVSINPAITWEPTVGIYVDGVFVAKNVGGLFDVAELERLEVLRGPQGTLYGKNTVGGAINLVTKKPAEEFGGMARLKVGNYNYREEHLSIDTGKLGDVASFNIAVNKRDRDGFYKNNHRGDKAAKRFKELDSTAARLAALFDVTDDFEIYYVYDMNRKDNTPTFGQFDPIDGPRDKRKSSGALDGAIYDKSKTQGHALTMTWDANDELTFKSLTAYRHVKFDDKNDYDGFVNDLADLSPPYGVYQFHTNRQAETKQASQEFQLSGDYDFVSFVTGLYYFNEDSKSSNPFAMHAYVPAAGQNVPMDVDNQYGVKSESYALYGQADWLLTDALTLTTGLRYTYEEKKAFLDHSDPGVFDYGSGANTFNKITAKDSWSNVSPMAALSYAWDDNINTYVKVSQGWKAGGFNGEAGPDVDPIFDQNFNIIGGTVNRTAEQVFKQSYDPEKIIAYELGLKTRYWDNRVQTNIALFYNDVKDMQVSNYLLAYSEIHNAGRAVIQGVELDVIVQVSEGLTANASYGYTDAKYKKYDAGSYGKKEAMFPYNPRHSASIGLDYVAIISAGELHARLDYNAKGSHYIFDAPDNARATKVNSYGILNGRIALAEIAVGGSDKQTLEVGFWGKNLTNEQYRINGIPVQNGKTGAVIGAVNYYGDPRTFGADITYKW